jgi:hypothetical protein
MIMETSQTTPLQLDWARAFPAYHGALRGALSGYLDAPRRFLSFLRRPNNLRTIARGCLGPLEKAARDLLLAQAPAPDALSGLAAAIRPLLNKGYVSELEIAQVIAEGYRTAAVLCEALAENGLGVQDLSAPAPINPRDYQGGAASYLAPVLGLDRFAQRALRQDLAGFFLHGSLATLDYAVDYSDLDTLMILKRATVVEPGRLVAFARRYRRSLTFIYQFDPLQHHGHILLTEVDLACYPNCFFPLSVLEYARSLGGPWAPLTVRYRDDRAEMTAEFARVCEAFARRAAEGYRPQGPFELKNFLSELMLLPTLYCQCLGSPCYKKFSFGRARPDFAGADWKVIDEATAVRSNWRYRRKAGGLAARAGRWLGSPEFVKARGENPSSTVMAEVAGLLGPDYVQVAGRLAQAMRQRAAERSHLN